MALKLLRSRLAGDPTPVPWETNPAMRWSLVLMTIGIGAGLFLFCGQAHAQYKYTDDKGVLKTTQYKADIPERFRDAAEWVGPTGIGKPGLSEEQRQWKQREDAYRRIGEADAVLGTSQSPAKSSRSGSGTLNKQAPELGKPMAEMCIAGEQRIMTSPGHWQVVGPCYSGWSR